MQLDNIFAYAWCLFHRTSRIGLGLRILDSFMVNSKNKSAKAGHASFDSYTFCLIIVGVQPLKKSWWFKPCQTYLPSTRIDVFPKGSSFLSRYDLAPRFVWIVKKHPTGNKRKTKRNLRPNNLQSVPPSPCCFCLPCRYSAAQESEDFVPPKRPAEGIYPAWLLVMAASLRYQVQGDMKPLLGACGSPTVPQSPQSVSLLKGLQVAFILKKLPHWSFLTR